MDEEFGQYLVSQRGYRMVVPIRNPAADEMVELLQKHLKTVSKWLNGQMNRAPMLEAMKFFAEYFPGQYEATEGRFLYRGQTSESFDGDPRSYSYDSEVADNFACGMFPFIDALLGKTIIVKRKVCRTCPDRPAFRLSLDIGKVLRAYADHKYANEKEVVILNTKPKAPAELMEVTCS